MLVEVEEVEDNQLEPINRMLLLQLDYFSFSLFILFLRH